MATLGVRLDEGVYEAVGELAQEWGVSKSDAATLLVFAGLSLTKGHVMSKRTQELMQADVLESVGALVRALAKLKPEERSAAEKRLGEFFEKLAKTFPGTG